MYDPDEKSTCTSPSNSEITSRPSTPPNNISNSSDTSLTPLPNYSDLEGERFIRRIDLHSMSRKAKYLSPRYGRPTRFSPLTSLSGRTDYSSGQSPDNKVTDPEQILCEYVNPFTPDGKLFIDKAKAQKRLKRLNINSGRTISIDDSDASEKESSDSSMDSDDIPMRHRLNEINVSRFKEEFVVLEKIGKGDHGCVFKCMNRINGCVYAIKKTINPIKSGIEERVIRNEIYAHGALDHRHIVRNYSCWNEDGFVFIQNEYCNGGNLENYVKSRKVTETILKSLLLQMCQALRYIHEKGLAHMDVKPGNILLCIEKRNRNTGLILKSDEGSSNEDKYDEIVFKLADLGHVTKIGEAKEVEEGDCRYLPKEILEEQLNHLDRADIFSLGLSVYEIAGGGPLPKNGEKWQHIRNGNLEVLEQHSMDFNNILKSMVAECPRNRPSAEQIIKLLEPNSSCNHFNSDEMIKNMDEPNNSILNERRYMDEPPDSILNQRFKGAGQYLELIMKSRIQMHEKLRGQICTIGKQLQEDFRAQAVAAGNDAKEKLSGGITKKKVAVTKNRIVGNKTMRSTSTTMF